MKLDGTAVALTGGSGGLGRVLAALLSAEGARVTIIDRTPPNEGHWSFMQADLSTSDGIAAAAAQLSASDTDMLINLAGVQFFGALEAQSEASILLTYMVNLVAPVTLTRALLPRLRRKNQGHIVNVGSTFASIPFAHFATYSSSKAGIKGFSEALRRELSDTEIGVTYVAPRAIKTPMNGQSVMQLAAATGMNMDSPERVATEIVRAIRNDKADVYIGFPESFFVRLNALAPRLVDRALASNAAAAREILAVPAP